MKKLNKDVAQFVDGNGLKFKATKNEIVEWLEKTKFVPFYVKSILHYPDQIAEYLDDYVQEVYLALLMIDEDKWQSIWDKDNIEGICGYIVRVIKFTVNSHTSRAYYKLKKYKEKEVFGQEFDNIFKDEES